MAVVDSSEVDLYVIKAETGTPNKWPPWAGDHYSELVASSDLIVVCGGLLRSSVMECGCGFWT